MTVRNGARHRDFALWALLGVLALAAPAFAQGDWETERRRRIALDFPHTRDAVIAQLRRDIPDLSDEEFARWDIPTLLESADVGGEKRYFHNAVPNLYRVSAEARARRATPWTTRDGPMETANAHHAEVIAKGSAARRVRVTQQLIVNGSPSK